MKCIKCVWVTVALLKVLTARHEVNGQGRGREVWQANMSINIIVIIISFSFTWHQLRLIARFSSSLIYFLRGKISGGQDYIFDHRSSRVNYKWYNNNKLLPVACQSHQFERQAINGHIVLQIVPWGSSWFLLSSCNGRALHERDELSVKILAELTGHCIKTTSLLPHFDLIVLRATWTPLLFTARRFI